MQHILAVGIWLLTCLQLAVRTFVAASAQSTGSAVLIGPRELLIDQASSTSTPRVCVVIRTYWQHSSQYTGALKRLLDSLQRQSLTRCGEPQDSRACTRTIAQIRRS